MKFTKLSWIIIFVLVSDLITGCNQNNTITGGGNFTRFAGLTNGPTLPVISGNNVLALTVNGSTCNAANSVGYLNKPCVSITICSTTNANCQTIDDVLVDTGSYGLRIFGSVLNSNLNLATVTSGGRTVGDCQQYGGGTADWGYVANANVTLGGETAPNIPIEIISPTFGKSSLCTTDSSGDTFTLDADPVSTGYNAIMGVGLFAADCGPDCAEYSDNGQYFSCSGSSCIGITMPESAQVSNPVAFMPLDNNGVIVSLPSIGLGGVSSINGYLILGIGTQSDNTPNDVSSYTTTASDEFGNFNTVFNGSTAIGFVDSGSNSYAFNDSSSLPDCTRSQDQGLFCPPSTVSLTATDDAATGTASAVVPFYIGNAATFNQSNNVFIEYGADDDGQGEFDWGLPFFIGRNIFVGLDGTNSPLGIGPFWAF